MGQGRLSLVTQAMDGYLAVLKLGANNVVSKSYQAWGRAALLARGNFACEQGFAAPNACIDLQGRGPPEV